MLQRLSMGLAGAAGLLLGAVTAEAADLPVQVPASIAAPAPYSPWQIRVRAIGVLPDASNGTLTAAGAPVAGATVNVSNSVVPELDISYYFTRNIAVELILATTRHNAYGAGTISNLGKLGSAWLLPPTLTLQYHFTDFGAFQPYVGAGINYTWMYSTKSNALTSFNMSNNVGFALQAGFDYMIDQHWGLNVDVKKLWLTSTATGFLGAAPVSTKVHLDPWIVGGGITYRF